MDWRIKGVVQKVLSHTPGGTALNDWLQQRAGVLRNLDENIRCKVMDDWVVLADHLRQLNIRCQDVELLEIGTGWFPALPLCWHLAGARSVLTYDINRHLNAALTFQLLARLEKYLPAVAAAAEEPLPLVQERYRKLSSHDSVDGLLQAAGIRYLAPADATTSGLPEASVDVVYSNNVLEHVPAPGIALMFGESARILRPGGVSLHSANCGDHYAYFDRSITQINYLQFSDQEWRFWDNGLLYQNRLRPQDFAKLMEQAGLELALYVFRPKPQLLQRLEGMRVAKEFAAYPPEQLCSTSVLLAGRRR